MRSLIVIILLGFVFESTGQSILSNSGDTYSTSTATIDFTIGESIVGFYENASSVNQGFHQIFIVDEPLGVSKALKADLVIFPNPAIDQMNIQLKKDIELSYQLFDLSGKRLKTGNLSRTNNIIDVSSLDEGVFRLQIQEDQKNSIASFLVVKKN